MRLADYLVNMLFVHSITPYDARIRVIHRIPIPKGREGMIPREADRVKAVLRRRNPMPLTRKSRACGGDSDSVGSQGASATDCVFAADADYAPCHPPSEGASGGAEARRRRRRRGRKRMIERSEDGATEGRKKGKGMMTAEEREREEQTRLDRKDGERGPEGSCRTETDEGERGRRATGERPKRGKTMKSELQIRENSPRDTAG